MEFTATPEFIERYERLDDGAAKCIDRAIRRIVDEPSSAWARQNRVVGELGVAWLVWLRCPRGDFGLYWWQTEPTEPVQLLLLLSR